MAEATIDLEAMKSLVDTMNTASTDLRGKKSDLVGILSGVSLDTAPPYPLETAATWVDGQVPGLHRRLALAQAIAASDPKFHGGGVVIDEAQLSTLSPSEAAVKAAAAAQALRDAAGKPDPALIAEITQSQNDPYYAAAVAEAFTPEELATLVKDASTSFPGGTPGATARDAPGFDEWSKRYKDELSALGTILGTATRNRSPDLALPADYAQKWVDQLTADVKYEGDTARESNQGNALALSYLLKFGTYSTPFLDTVASKAYDYERQHDDSPVWAPKSGGDGYGWPVDPLWDRNQPASKDVLANIMLGLGHNAGAAQHFFSQGGDEKVKLNGQDVEVNARLKYLLQDRTWSKDRLSDEGDGLGDALRAASTVYRNRLPSGLASATTASETVALLGSKTGEGSSGGHWYLLGGGASGGWKMPSALRSDVADILASYVPDLYREYHSSERPSDTVPPWYQTSNSQGVEGDPFGMSLDHTNLARVIQTLGENSANIDKISTSVLAYNQYQLNHLFSGITDPQTKVNILEGKDWPPMTAAMQMGPDVLHNLFKDAYTGDDAQEQIDKANKEALNKFVDLAGSLPVVKISNEAGKWAFDAMKGQVLDQLKKGPDAEASKLWTDEANKQTDALTHNFQNVMLQNGFYDPEVIKLIQERATQDGGYTAPPKDALRYDDKGNVVGFDFQSAAYDDWANGLYDKEHHPTWGTMPGGQLSEDVKQIYVTNFGVKF
jgi:hypothetical protein